MAATTTQQQQHHFTNITRKKYDNNINNNHYNNKHFNGQFISTSCIHNNNLYLYGKCIQNVFRIRMRLRRYKWTKMLPTWTHEI